MTSTDYRQRKKRGRQKLVTLKRRQPQSRQGRQKRQRRSRSPAWQRKDSGNPKKLPVQLLRLDPLWELLSSLHLRPQPLPQVLLLTGTTTCTKSPQRPRESQPPRRLTEILPLPRPHEIQRLLHLLRPTLPLPPHRPHRKEALSPSSIS